MHIINRNYVVSENDSFIHDDSYHNSLFHIKSLTQTGHLQQFTFFSRTDTVLPNIPP